MLKKSILESINAPRDLHWLTQNQLTQLCTEIREFLIASVAKTGGHLASNLGVVELSVALHRVFDSPTDQIVWDVGHQCYTHKLLTGRRELFATLRQENGISGFPKTTESDCDAFLAGHSSTSLAVADGLAAAKLLRRETGHVLAVLGDGSFTGGMAFEGLNNLARRKRDVIVILNDNKMSISKNVGSVSRYLARLRTRNIYFKLKDFTKSAMQAVPFLGSGLFELAAASKGHLKNALYSTSFFEDMGFVHMGPVDGHDLEQLCDVLARAKSLHRPVFIHVETVKGKGYKPAEQNPGAYHGVSKFDPVIGSDGAISDDCFSAVFGKSLTALARENPAICAVTAAMKHATGLGPFYKEHKRDGRFYDVGIAEQHAVTFCGALASRGLVPVFAVYSSFLQRAYDQILHDCAIEPRHVVLAIDRAGLVGEDGETHQGLFDCAFLSTIPGVTIYAPATYGELESCLRLAVESGEGIQAVRYPRGAQPDAPQEYAAEDTNFHYRKAAGANTLLVTYGRLYTAAAEAAARMDGEGQAVSLLKLTRVAPVDTRALRIAGRYERIFFAEEGIKAGGIAEQFLCALTEQGYRGEYYIRAVDNRFVPQAPVARQFQILGIDSLGLCGWVKQATLERKTS